MRNIAVIVVSLILTFHLGTASSGDFCPPSEPESDPVEYSGGVEEDAHRFKWMSDADQNPSDQSRYCYERIVTNNHDKNPLRFDWPLGRMSAKSVSPGGSSKKYSQYGDYKKPAASGPLYYGRSDKFTDTKVWEGEDEPSVKATAPFRTVYFIDLFEAGKTVSIGLSFFSSVKTSSAYYVYRYEMRNIGKAEAEFIWNSALSKDFEVNLKRIGLEPVMELIPKGKPVLISFETLKSPIVVDKTVDIIGPEGDVNAAVFVPAYVPTGDK